MIPQDKVVYPFHQGNNFLGDNYYTRKHHWQQEGLNKFLVDSLDTSSWTLYP
jgi:hypothetical protein